MSLEKEIENAFRIIIKKAIPVYVTEGTVKSVDKIARTCDVYREELADLTDVRLNSILEAGNDVITVFPKAGSKVICIMIENDPTDAYMIAANDIEEISGQIGDMKLLWDQDGFVFNDGTLEGLVKAVELKAQLDKTNSYCSTLKTATKAIATAIDALIPGTSAAFELAMTTAELGNYNDIQNDKIKH